MRYRVEVADRPDGQYAARTSGDSRTPENPAIFAAERSTADATVLLGTLPGDAPPEDFDTEWNGAAAGLVPESEITSTFTIRTLARHDDEYYHIDPEAGGGELTLRWTGREEVRARELGLVEGTTTIDDVENLTALWQERHDRAGPDAALPEPGSGDTNRILRAIGRTLLGVVPQGWERVAAQFRRVGDYSELEVRAVGSDDEGPVILALSAPPRLGQLFTELRAAMFEKGSGTWAQGTFSLDTNSNFNFDYDLTAEPDWRIGPEVTDTAGNERSTTRGHDAELEYFPRERENTPTWLAAKAGLPVEVDFRHARVVDAHNQGEPPVVNRHPVPQEEAQALLGYLYRAPVVLSRQGQRQDIFAPAAAADVPDAFHTDGTWIWSAAVPHYLRKYGLPPEPDLLEHIRKAEHRPPQVEKVVRDAARSELEGTPAPRRPDPNARRALPEAVRRGAEPDGTARASEILTVLHTRLAELGVADEVYRIGEAADGAWCLHKVGTAWEVARYADGEPVQPEYFDRLEPAARCLLGTLLLYPGRARAGAEADPNDPAIQASDWPIAPLRGEPPLTFLRGKRMTVLAAGTVLRRFGNEGGNLVHADGTEFTETSLTPEREHQQRSLRVRRPLHVLTGVSAEFNGLPGGAVSHLLPHAVGHHVETGALERL